MADPGEPLKGAYITCVDGVSVVGVVGMEVGFAHRHCKAKPNDANMR